jgi:hypothetical protein
VMITMLPKRTNTVLHLKIGNLSARDKRPTGRGPRTKYNDLMAVLHPETPSGRTLGDWVSVFAVHSKWRRSGRIRLEVWLEITVNE